MTTITATIQSDKDVRLLSEVLERFGIPYTVTDGAEEYQFSATELESFRQAQADYSKEKTTAKD